MNALIIASTPGTMLFYHGKFVLDGFHIAAHITGIAILRDQLEGDLLTPAANQQRDVWLLYSFGLIDRAAHLVIGALKDRFLLGPHRQDHLESLAQITQACGSVGILVA